MKWVFVLSMFFWTFVFSGCITGVVPFGKDTYLADGRETPFSIYNAQVKVTQRAVGYCRSQGRVMQPQRWMTYGNRHQLIFWCVNSVEATRTMPKADANVRIEVEK